MKITGTRGQYPDVDGVQVSIGSDFVVMSSQRGWEMLDPYDARELAAHLTKAANHVIAMEINKVLASSKPAQEEGQGDG